MTASVEVITDRKSNILSVPISAVTTRNEKVEKTTPRANTTTKPLKEEPIKEVVFVDSAGIAKVREVKTGISDFENIEVLSGLKAGDKIVSGPFIVVSKRLKDGDKIILKKPEDKKADAKSKENDN
jgi:HlyD family secretion protein